MRGAVCSGSLENQGLKDILSMLWVKWKKTANEVVDHKCLLTFDV
jgi:hypothetical protein